MFRRLCAITVFVLLMASQAAHAEGFTEHYKPLNPPRPVPVISFEDPKGRIRNLMDFRGEYVLLHFWATWCLPCANEMPSLNALQNRFNIHRFVVVALDEDHDALSAGPDFYRRHGLASLQFFIDQTGHAPLAFGAESLPSSLLINPEGLEIGHINGSTDWNAPDAVAFITQFIAPSHAGP